MFHRALSYQVWLALAVALASACSSTSSAPPVGRDGGRDVSASSVADATDDRPAILDLANDSPADLSDAEGPADPRAEDNRDSRVAADVAIDQADVRDADAIADRPDATDRGYDLASLADVAGVAGVADVGITDLGSERAPSGCEGEVDGGCTCSPVLPGAGSSFAVAGTLGNLLADPAACRLYALSTAAPSEIVVIDTARKKELTRIALAGQATDLDISPDGAYLVASMVKLKQLAVVDKNAWTVRSVGTVVAPQAVQVGNGGIAYYIDPTSWAELHRIELDVGIASDIMLGNLTVNDLQVSSPDLQLSPDGADLFLGESGTSGCNLYGVNVVGPILTHVGQSDWGDGYGFSFPERYVYLGPSGKHIYYAGYQLDAKNLGLLLGKSGKVFAEATAGTWAISDQGIIDANLLTRVAALPSTMTAAALTASDTELWFYGAGKMNYANMADFVAGKVPGVRETDALPLSNYALTKLVADPKRPLLYGLDPKLRVVVSIDRSTGTALRSVVVGSSPSDLAIDPSGTYLYVGHSETMALAQIDAKTLTFLQYITTPRVDYDIAPLGSARIATIDYDQWTTPTLIDVATGKVLDSVHWGAYTGSLAATADGNTLFVGGMSEPITRYDVSGGKLRQVAQSSADIGTSSLVATPDGSSVFAANRSVDGTSLTVRYALPDKVLSITPSGALGVTASGVFRVSDGTQVLSLSTGCSVQAVDPTGSTLYCAQGGGMVTVDLRGIQ